MRDPIADFTFIAKDTTDLKRHNYLFYLRDQHPYVFQGMTDEKIRAASMDDRALVMLRAACCLVKNALDKTYDNPSQPIYLGLGEDHTNPDNMAYQALVLRGLAAAGLPLSVNREYRSNSIVSSYANALAKRTGRDKQGILKSARALAEHDKSIVNKMSFSSVNWSYAPYATKLFEDFLNKHSDANKYGVLFSEPEKIYVDHDTNILSKETCQLIKSMLPVEKEFTQAERISLIRGRIDSKSRLGMYLRNFYAIEKLPTQGVVVDIQGALHLHGDVLCRFGLDTQNGSDNLPLNESKSFLAQQKGFDVITSVFQGVCHDLPSQIKWNAKRHEAQGMSYYVSRFGENLMFDLPCVKFYEAGDDESLEQVVHAHSEEREQEKAHTERLYQQFGLLAEDAPTLPERVENVRGACDKRVLANLEEESQYTDIHSMVAELAHQ